MMCESNVIFNNGELMCGLMDKNSIGAAKSSIVHVCHTLYGDQCSSRIISSLSHMLTYSVQIRGFTLGIEDILLQKHITKKRHKLLAQIDSEVARLNNEPDSSENFKTLSTNLANDFKSEITNLCKSGKKTGLLKKFPENNLQLMINSGAKGNHLDPICLIFFE